MVVPNKGPVMVLIDLSEIIRIRSSRVQKNLKT